jgi:hypothetical protein
VKFFKFYSDASNNPVFVVKEEKNEYKVLVFYERYGIERNKWAWSSRWIDDIRDDEGQASERIWKGILKKMGTTKYGNLIKIIFEEE